MVMVMVQMVQMRWERGKRGGEEKGGERGRKKGRAVQIGRAHV